MTKKANSQCEGQTGFSLPELIIVVAIILTISAIAVPALLNGIADVKLRSSASTLQGHLQQLRMRAIKENRPLRARLSSEVGTGVTVMYIDLDDGDDFDATEPSVSFSTDVTVAATGGPVLTNTQVVNVGTFVIGTTSNSIFFNARGLPCDTSGSAACQTQRGYVYYLSQLRSSGSTVYAAVSVTPAGRIRVWRRLGTTWQ